MPINGGQVGILVNLQDGLSVGWWSTYGLSGGNQESGIKCGMSNLDLWNDTSGSYRSIGFQMDYGGIKAAGIMHFMADVPVTLLEEGYHPQS